MAMEVKSNMENTHNSAEKRFKAPATAPLIVFKSRIKTNDCIHEPHSPGGCCRDRNRIWADFSDATAVEPDALVNAPVQTFQIAQSNNSRCRSKLVGHSFENCACFLRHLPIAPGQMLRSQDILFLAGRTLLASDVNKAAQRPRGTSIRSQSARANLKLQLSTRQKCSSKNAAEICEDVIKTCKEMSVSVCNPCHEAAMQRGTTAKRRHGGAD